MRQRSGFSEKSFLAAKEGLAYYELALDECYKLQNNN
jgi:hypothetical protein